MKTAAKALLATFGALALVSAPAQAAQADTKAAAPAPQAKKPATKPAAPGVVIEPRAIELLKAASARLAAAKSMAFTAVVTYEYPSLVGPALAFTTRSEVALQRPDKLLIVTRADGPASELYYDGKTIMAYSPKEDLVAYGEASGPIASALELLYRESGTYYPFVDLIVADPHAAMTDGLKLAFVVGRSTVVGGTPTDMVAFSNGEVFVQMWIGVDDKLPRRVRAMYAKDQLQLRHQLDIEGWQLDVAHAPEKFTSAKAAKAKRIPFAAPAFVATKGAKVLPPKAPQPAKSAPAKAQ